GASGAIAGVLGGYLLLHPHARILVLVPLGIIFWTMRLPALLVLGMWFVLQFLNAAATPTGEPGVAWFAHVGGFIAGMILIPIFKHRHVPLFDRGRLRHPVSGPRPVQTTGDRDWDKASRKPGSEGSVPQSR